MALAEGREQLQPKNNLNLGSGLIELEAGNTPHSPRGYGHLEMSVELKAGGQPQPKELGLGTG